MSIELKSMAMPVLAMRGVAVFPGMTLNFDVGRARSVAALKSALNGDRMIFLVPQHDVATEEPDFTDLYSVGCVAEVKQLVKLPNSDAIRAVVEGKYRAAVTEALRVKPMLKAVVTEIPSKPVKTEDELMAEAYVRSIKEVFDSYCDNAPRLSPDVPLSVYSNDDLDSLTDYIAGNIPLELSDKMNVLYEFDVLKRAELLCKILVKESQLLEIEADIQERVQEHIDKGQKEYFLREQIRTISQELNEDDSPISEAEKYRALIEKLPMSDKSKKKLYDECDRLVKTAPGSPESTVSRTYLDRVINLPWGVYNKESLNLNKAKRILDRDHYGLDEVKERILELIAVKKLSPDVNAQIICLVGPPGVGKTSIAKSLAEAMGRKYVRVALGGVRDEAEIRGHRKTYIGSMPGRIITALEQVETSNPLMLLDEIDKLSNDNRGDPSSALLEVLDGEQNSTFCDHYIEVPFDLSKVLFITTANDASLIPAPLYDRMEIIELYSYTALEKFNIAKKHLIPKQLKNFNIDSKLFKITDKALKTIILNYTKEAGVRTLERLIAKILRKVAVKIVEGNDGKITVDVNDLYEYLGTVKYKGNDLDLDNMVGAANGLAWTSVGGEMMQIEVAVLEGSGKLELTGSLGDVMKESAKAAVSYIRAHSDVLGIDCDFYKNKDIHIHVPEGAVPKDGPSAGVTMTTALVSALTGNAVCRDVAMTGEISLRGRVMPIGGLREKSMAAYKNGMKTVLIPVDNVADLDKVDGEIKQNIRFIPVSCLEEVLDLAIEKPLKEDETVNKTVITASVENHGKQSVYCCNRG